MEFVIARPLPGVGAAARSTESWRPKLQCLPVELQQEALTRVEHQEPCVRLAGVVITAGFVAFVVIEVVRYDFWWPALALGGLIANRVVGLLTGGLASEDAKMNVLRDTIWSLVLYLFAVAPTFYIAVPMLGAAAAPLSAEHARWCVLPGDLVADFFDQQLAGDWCAEPHRALAGGALYFLAAAFRDMRRARRERG